MFDHPCGNCNTQLYMNILQMRCKSSMFKCWTICEKKYHFLAYIYDGMYCRAVENARAWKWLLS